MPSVGSSSRMSRGPAAQAARQRQQLLLAAGERAAGTVEQRLEAREILQHRLDDLGIGGAEDGRGHAQILQHRQRRKDLAPLRHVADAEARAPIGRQRRHVPILEAHLPAGGAARRR